MCGGKLFPFVEPADYERSRLGGTTDSNPTTNVPKMTRACGVLGSPSCVRSETTLPQERL